MSDRQRIESLFQRSDPDLPTSDPPRMSELRICVQRRRRQRKIVTSALFGGAVCCLLALILSKPSTQFDAITAPGASVTLHHDQAQQRQPAVSRASIEPGGVRVFARVRLQTPVFGLDEETRYLRHVGWIDSEETVPVDLSQFPSAQRENLEAVLFQNDQDNYFNL